MMDNKNFLIYGLNNAKALLSSKKYKIISVNILLDSIASKDKSLIKKISSLNLDIQYLNKNQYNMKYNFKHTQGIVMEFDGDILQEFDIIDKTKNNTCYIIIDKINDPQNLGQIIRTCECSGIDGIILPRHGSVHITNTVLQVSQGAFININLFVVTNITNTILKLKEEGFWITGIENSINGKKWHEVDYTGKVGIVFGSEGKGISRLVLKSCDFLSTIPMLGKTNSLNVSSAISTIVFERQRQIFIKENLKN